MSESMKVEVLDRIMGSGKTQAMIQWMSKSFEKFIYVTPLLSEVETRVGIDEGLDIEFPMICKTHTTKGSSLLSLLKQGKNIATTHSMYSQLKDEHLSIIKDSGYIVICDEQIETIAPLNNIDCANLLDSGNISVDSLTGNVLWTGTVLDKYKSFKSKCDRGLVFASKSGTGHFVVTTQLPLKLIVSAKRFIICTYLFQGSILQLFLSLKGCQIVPFTEIPDSCFKQVRKEDIRKLISFVGSDTQLKNVYKYKLTANWWNTASEEEVNNVSKVITAIGKQHKIDKSSIVWCIPKGNVTSEHVARGVKKSVIMKQTRYPAGVDCESFEWVEDSDDMDDENPSQTKRLYTEQERADKRCYLPCNAIATNLYSDRTYMLHFQNRYSHLIVKNYLHASGVYLDDDLFALSELIQWLWRSSIRNEKPINVCLGSVRMRDLLERWMWSAD